MLYEIQQFLLLHEDLDTTPDTYLDAWSNDFSEEHHWQTQQGQNHFCTHRQNIHERQHEPREEESEYGNENSPHSCGRKSHYHNTSVVHTKLGIAVYAVKSFGDGCHCVGLLFLWKCACKPQLCRKRVQVFRYLALFKAFLYSMGYIIII